jgi:putative inorganic carbon (HCO3(-)) transporter
MGIRHKPAISPTIASYNKKMRTYDKYNKVYLSFLLASITGFVIGFLFLEKPIYALAFLLGIPSLVLLYSKPEWGIIVILFLTATFVYDFDFFYVSLGFGKVAITDLLLMFMVFQILFRKFTYFNFKFRRTVLDIPLVFFFCAMLMGLCVAVFRYNIPFRAAKAQVHTLAYYSIFFVVMNLVKDLRTVRILIVSSFVIACLVSLGMILKNSTGGAFDFLIGYAGSQGEYEGVLRIFPPGSYLIFICLVTILSILLISNNPKNRFLFLCILALLAVGILLTFTRTFWVVGIVCCLVIFYFTSLKRKAKFVTYLSLSILVISALAMVFVPMNRLRVAVEERFLTLIDVNVVRSGSAEWRLTEYKYAIRKIEESPIVGIGLSSDYRPPFFRDDQLTYFIHNSYLWILKDMGVIGLIPFLILMMRFLIRGFKNWRSVKDSYLRAVVLGYTVGFLGLLLFALQGGTFMGHSSVSVFGFIMGLNEVVYKLDEREPGEAGKVEIQCHRGL